MPDKRSSIMFDSLKGSTELEGRVETTLKSLTETILYWIIDKNP